MSGSGHRPERNMCTHKGLGSNHRSDRSYTGPKDKPDARGDWLSQQGVLEPVWPLRVTLNRDTETGPLYTCPCLQAVKADCPWGESMALGQTVAFSTRSYGPWWSARKVTGGGPLNPEGCLHGTLQCPPRCLCLCRTAQEGRRNALVHGTWNVCFL